MRSAVPDKVMVLGGDGFCGWPTALHLSSFGYDVTIVDNLSRRAIDVELKAGSLTPIASIYDRISAWKEVSGNSIRYINFNVAEDYNRLVKAIAEIRPSAVIHFAEQRAAPYSMKGETQKRYTVDNNVKTTHNLLVAISTCLPDCHIVHLGTMGVYGYNGDGLSIPEGYLDVFVKADDGRTLRRNIVYPTKPGSVYHMTKSIDQIMFQFYAGNDRLRITDLHQGIVWGAQTDETRLHPALINRFDYDGDYGTVLNRFLVQAAVGHPLTVHGTGGQTRGFINVQDTVRCIRLAIENPPTRGDRVRIRNQVTETHRVRELAVLVAGLTDAKIEFVSNPRLESAENDLEVNNQSFLELGLDPIRLSDGLMTEIFEVSKKYADRVDFPRIPARSLWTTELSRQEKIA